MTPKKFGIFLSTKKNMNTIKKKKCFIQIHVIPGVLHFSALAASRHNRQDCSHWFKWLRTWLLSVLVHSTGIILIPRSSFLYRCTELPVCIEKVIHKNDREWARASQQLCIIIFTYSSALWVKGANSGAFLTGKDKTLLQQKHAISWRKEMQCSAM